MNYNKVNKYLKNLKKSHKSRSFNNLIWKISPRNLLRLGKKHIGNIEFFCFMSGLCYSLYYISKHNEKFSETTKIISLGLVTHVLVDVSTYFIDKLNTNSKVEIFKIKYNRIVSNYFMSKYYFERKISFKEGDLKKSLIGHYLISYKGIQPGVYCLFLNSVFFYGAYKNLKQYFKEKLGIEGFFNFFLSAGLSQFIAMCFAFPFENLKTRMQASEFTYEKSILKYYKDSIFKGKLGFSNFCKRIKIEYSGFISHLVLYVIYEAFTFGIYEYIIKLMKSQNYEISKIENGSIKKAKTDEHTLLGKNSDDAIDENIMVENKKRDLEIINKYEKNKTNNESLSIGYENIYNYEIKGNNIDTVKRTKINEKQIDVQIPLKTENVKHKDIKEVNVTTNQIIVASFISGVISAIVTNPLDVYQINKQINGKFKISYINSSNMFAGLKIRIAYFSTMNIVMFYLLETIGPKYYNVHLDDH